MAKRRGKGEGSISRRPSGNYRAYVTKNGERIHFTGKTKTECQEWMKATLNQIDKGLTVKGAQITLREYLTEWLINQKSQLGYSAYKDYSRYCEKDIIPVLGNIKLKDQNLNLINAFYRKLLNDERGIPTIRYIHRVLHAAFADTINLGLLGHNPSSGANVPKNKPHQVQNQMSLMEFGEIQDDELENISEDFMDEKTQVWTESELSRFLISAMQSPRYALYDLEAKTGLRSGELRGLSVKDVEFKENYALIKIRRQVRWEKEIGWVFGRLKTKASYRTLKVGVNTANILREHIRQLEVLKEVNKNRWKEFGLLFPSNAGTPICQSNLRKEFNALIKIAGIEQIRFHDLRHTVASILLSNKIPLVIVSKILGHSKPSVTSDIYYHFIPSSSDEASNFMDGLTPTIINIDTMLVESINSSIDVQK